MADFKAAKVVAALPATLEADTVYFIRSGSGFDMKVTNGTGTIVALDLNQPAPSGGAKTKKVVEYIFESGDWVRPDGIVGNQVSVTLIGSGAKTHTSVLGTTGELIQDLLVDVSEHPTVSYTVGASVGGASDIAGNPTSFGTLVTAMGGLTVGIPNTGLRGFMGRNVAPSTSVIGNYNRRPSNKYTDGLDIYVAGQGTSNALGIVFYDLPAGKVNYRTVMSGYVVDGFGAAGARTSSNDAAYNSGPGIIRLEYYIEVQP